MLPKYGIYSFWDFGPHDPAHFLFVYKDSMTIIHGKEVSSIFIEYDHFMKTNNYNCGTKYKALLAITHLLSSNYIYRPGKLSK